MHLYQTDEEPAMAFEERRMAIQELRAFGISINDLAESEPPVQKRPRHPAFLIPFSLSLVMLSIYMLLVSTSSVVISAGSMMRDPFPRPSIPVVDPLVSTDTYSGTVIYNVVGKY